MGRLMYTRNQLIELSSQATKLSPEAWNTLNSERINLKIPTKRGSRGGKKRTKKIRISVGNRPGEKSHIGRGVNHENLIQLTRSPIKTNTPSFTLCLINAQSVRNKSTVIHDYLLEHDLDILTITETWLKSKDTSVIKDMLPSNYDIINVNRARRTGGGVAIIHKRSLSVKVHSPGTYSTIEMVEATFSGESKSLTLSVIYRPPKSTKNRSSYSEFQKEFSQVAETKLSTLHDFLLVGDFNMHVENVDRPETQQFKELLDSFNLHQHVTESTHRSGHTLDLLISRRGGSTLKSCRVEDHMISDHMSVFCELNLPRSAPPKKLIKYRKTKSIDLELFEEDLDRATLLDRISQRSSVCDQVELLNTVLSNTLDKHAPIQKRTVVIRPDTSWYTNEIRESKREKRRAEKLWRRTRLEVHRQMYRTARDHHNALLVTTRVSHINSRIAASTTKSLFKEVNSLLHKETQEILPEHTSKSELANRFSSFFSTKIEKIRKELEQGEPTHDSAPDTCFSGERLAAFEPTTLKEVLNLISISPSKSCDLDPLPTWLLKANMNVVAPAVVQIFNSSLATSEVPECFKTALVRPLIKKPSLDPNVISNYRPVSNLPFLSKVLEKVVASRIRKHIQDNGLMEEFQSAYRPHHSTETALLRMQNDILSHLDDKNVSIVVLLDLSAAFDTIDHNILLSRLEDTVGITGAALQWVASYLKDRTQSVVIEDSSSDAEPLLQGVPQGSVLGPLLFIIYILPLGDIFRRHTIPFHGYADDTQCGIASKLTSLPNKIKELENCVADVRVWMRKNFLKLNDGKTEVFIAGPRHQRQDMLLHSVNIGQTAIPVSEQVKNLGVFWDSSMTMSRQITNICQSSYFHLHQIGRLRRYLTTETSRTLMQALVISRLDYANSLLYGISKSLIHRLQVIQNTAARIITRCPRRQHMTPVLRDLHWLPIEHRITFKLLTLTYSCLKTDTAPTYLSSLLQPYVPSRNLRSQDNDQLVQVKTKSKFGDRSFQCAAPILWNNLPLSIKSAPSKDSFRRQLKTFLFPTD